MKKQGSTAETRLTELLKRSVRTLGVTTNPRRAGRLPATGDVRSRQYAHEKPTKTRNVVGAPKPAAQRPKLPRLKVTTWLDLVRSPDGAIIGMGPARTLFAVTQRDPEGRDRLEQVVLSGEGLDRGFGGPPLAFVEFLALAPEMAGLLARLVAGGEGRISQRQLNIRRSAAFKEARAFLASLPFEVTP